jgi:hypothetical protein
MQITQAANGQRLHVGDNTTVAGIITALTNNQTLGAVTVSVTATVQLLGTLTSVSVDIRDLNGRERNTVENNGGAAFFVNSRVTFSGQVLTITGVGNTATLGIQLDFSGVVTVGAQDCTTGSGAV